MADLQSRHLFLHTPLFSDEFEASAECSTIKARGAAPKRMHNRGGHMRSDFLKYIRNTLLDSIGLKGNHQRINMGPLKEPERIEEKAISQYQGDRRQVGDVVRATVYLNAGPELDAFLKKLKLGKHNSLSKHFDTDKVRLRRSPRDDILLPKIHIEQPKKWGWMGIYMKVQIEKDGEPFPAEIQIYPEGMAEAYKKTHALYAKVRPAIERWEAACANAWDRSQKEPTLQSMLTEDELETIKEMLRIHKEAARKCGLLEYVKGNFPSIENISPDHLEEEDVSSPFAEEFIELNYSYDGCNYSAILTPDQVDEIWHILKSFNATNFDNVPFVRIDTSKDLPDVYIEDGVLLTGHDENPFVFAKGTFVQANLLDDIDPLYTNIIRQMITAYHNGNIKMAEERLRRRQELSEEAAQPSDAPFEPSNG